MANCIYLYISFFEQNFFESKILIIVKVYIANGLLTTVKTKQSLTTKFTKQTKHARLITK